jgi:hypothetical protein
MLKSALIAIALTAATIVPAHALDFSKHANDSPTENAIQAKGSIVAEDAFRFQAYLSKLPDKKVTSLYLESTGGNIAGALALGRQVNKAGVRTFAIDGAGCMSACVYVLVAGKDGEAGKPYRVKGTATSLGLHHFTPGLENKPSFTMKDLHAVEARAQKVALDLTLYFEEMDADLELLSYGLRQTEIYNLKNDEALPLGLHVMDAASKEIILSDKFRARAKR